MYRDISDSPASGGFLFVTDGGLCSFQTFSLRIPGAAFLLLFEAQVSGFDRQRHGQEDAHDVEAEVPRSVEL